MGMKAFSSAVVKLPEDPSPVPAGMSAMLVISNDAASIPTSSKRFPDYGMLHFCDRRDALELGIFDDQSWDKRLMQCDINVPINGRCNEETRMLLVIGRQVGAAAAQRNAQR